MLKLIKQDIPSLCIHDELIVPEQYADITEQLLTKIYSNEIFIGSELKLDNK